MNIDESMVGVICEIENIIGSETYNASYNDEEGCDFRYPVEYYFSKKDEQEGKLKKEREVVSSFIHPDCIDTMRYKFGSNQLNIGIAIQNVLDFLEKRYQLDFNQLELEYKSRHREEIKAWVKNGDEVVFGSGKYIVGVDLPDGKYIVTDGDIVVGGDKGLILEGNEVILENQDTVIVLIKATLKTK